MSEVAFAVAASLCVVLIAREWRRYRVSERNKVEAIRLLAADGVCLVYESWHLYRVGTSAHAYAIIKTNKRGDAVIDHDEEFADLDRAVNRYVELSGIKL